MNCLKCGREIDEDRVFCPECLADMEKYPVRPGTAVHLPKRPAYNPVRRNVPKRKAAAPEEIIRKQRKMISRLILALVVTSILALVLAFPAISHLLENRELPIGQNFKVIEDLLPTEEAAD